MKLHLLGTGTPILDSLRPTSSAFLVEVAQEKILFDTGRGTTIQLLKQGFSPVELDAIFITHHHYDHICDLGEVLMAAWHNGRARPLPVYGPTGTAKIVDTLLNQVFAADIAFNQFLNPAAVDVRELVTVIDIVGGWRYQTANWHISAEAVHHGHGLGLSQSQWLCLGYRLEAEGKALAIGGDAVACEGLNKLALDADTLLLSCYLAEEEVIALGFERLAKHVIATAGQVGKIAQRARVQKLVLTHFRKKAARLMHALAQEVQADFAGELIMGEDLTVVEV